ncbi:MAG TPA: alanine--tRNA ligase [Kofleriaceae bacterium]|jgi:alanyl-tRNA synthetase|nr:alanine--tRNA ligase [Kofleriaceae bacterium]
MKAADVRTAFLEFWSRKGHSVVASSSLVPSNDPTLLFTNAGMVQFKDVFTGAETRSYKRATTSQKCVRAGGKHNDLDEVGKTPRHHTFFEMLGNFSFGDYFKADAIAGAWELLTQVYRIDPSRLCVTVFGGDPAEGLAPDDEARQIWKRVTGFGDDRVIGLGKKDNFWAMGDTGPMGPCSEIHYCMNGVPARWPTTEPETWTGWLEIWNLVFMQFERRTPGGELFPLPAPSIDTGAGLERMTSVLQGVASNYDTDLFTGILAKTAALAGTTYGKDPEVDTSLRVIADHARCTTFLIADGVFPDNTGREYVLRRIFRRAVRHGTLLGIDKPFMHEVCREVVAEMGAHYPELTQHATTISNVALAEEKRFRQTLDQGVKLLEDEFAAMQKTGLVQVPGKAVFTLYDTFGFPDDLTEIIAGERGFTVDKLGFEDELDKARKRSRFQGSDQEAIAGEIKAVANEVGATKFTGYDGRGTTGDGVIKAILLDGERVQHASAGARVHLVFDQTPFYAESGGQIGDTGVVKTEGAEVRIDDTKKPTGDVHVLVGEVTLGSIRTGDRVSFAVDDERRERIRANHSATHLLHHALKAVLGDHVAQKGSLVAPDRLRFDFAQFSPMTEDQKRQVEDLVNREIRRNLDSVVEVLPIAEAKQRGAVAMFGEKYGERVRVVSIGGDSIEFCGGTHVRRAGDIGLFKILSEAGVAQGVRRIEAVTGAGALDYLRKLEDELQKTGDRLKAAPFEVAQRVDKLLADQRALDREIDKLKQRLASGAGARDLMTDVVTIKGIKVLATSVEVDDAKVLRDTGDQLRDKLGSGVIVLAGTGGAEVRLVAMVTKDLVDKLSAGKLLGEIARILGGRAGGRPDMAQGGGKDASQVPAALGAARKWVEDHV